MRALLDTHTFLWFITDDSQLSDSARTTLEDGGNEILLSVASIWEMAIKVSLGKLALAGPFDNYIEEQLRLNAIDVLSITVAHVAAVVSLPFHHRDPFDRLLVAQASVEGIPIIGADTAFDAYPIIRIW